MLGIQSNVDSLFSLIGRRNGRDAIAVSKYYCCPRDSNLVYGTALLIVVQIVRKSDTETRFLR